jgi:DNA-binding protein WhiA
VIEVSFSFKVKGELSRHQEDPRHCMLAEMAGIMNMCGQITVIQQKVCVKVQTENAAVARKYFTLVKKTFNIDSEVLIRRNTQLKKNRVYILLVRGAHQVEKLLTATGLIYTHEHKIYVANRIYPLIVQSTCCKRAYIRGAFLGGGSLSDPEKTYHLEFVNTEYDHSVELQHLINTFGMDAKIVERKKHFVVYLKEGEQVVDLLNIMGAHMALMDLENIRILKDMRNNVNRIVNCETANLNKTVSASVKQMEDIRYIHDTVGIQYLPDALRETTQMRIQFPEVSLKELGSMLNPPVGKSGVNHRLRKISMIVQNLRKDRGGLS